MDTIKIECAGYTLTADVYESKNSGPVLLSLLGRTSRRTKRQYRNFFPRLAEELNITSVVFDYSGHGDTPGDLEDIRPAQHFLETITVFDWIAEKYPNRKIIVIGSSYGGLMATQLTKYREFEGLLLRAPAIYPPSLFYTKKKDEDRDAVMQFRHDKQALKDHPLLLHASAFKGKTLVMVHENDEHIPREVTDAYREALGAEEVVVQGITHSLDDATDQQVQVYVQKIYEWLKTF